METGLNLKLEKHVIFGMINNEKCRFVNWLTVNIKDESSETKIKY